MCEYCEKGKEIRNDNNIKSFISKAHFGYSIISQISNNCFNLGFINYCPMCRKEARRVKFETKKKLRQDIEKLEKEKKELIEKKKTNYDLYKVVIAIMLQAHRKCIEIDLRAVLAADDYELVFGNNPLKTTKEIKLVRRASNDN